MWVSVHIARSSAYMVSTTFPLHCRVHVVDHDVEQQGGDHRSLRNAHTYSFGGRRGSLPPDLRRSVAQEESDVVEHVARNSDLVEFL